MRVMESNKFMFSQLLWLVVLRVAIGWHFLYEGLVKVSNSNWSSVGYLMDSNGFFKGFYHFIASNSSILGMADFMNIWGLIAIGTSLIIGFLSRPAIISAIVLLGFYYLSHPPFIGLEYAMPTVGSFFIVDKTLIELIALAVLFVFPTNYQIGIDRFIFKQKTTL